MNTTTMTAVKNPFPPRPIRQFKSGDGGEHPEAPPVTELAEAAAATRVKEPGDLGMAPPAGRVAEIEARAGDDAREWWVVEAGLEKKQSSAGGESDSG